MMLIERITDEAEILQTMSVCRDDFFDQSVSAPERIGKLAAKFTAHAVFLRATVDGETAGFIAFYANDYISRVGYLSMIVVHGGLQGFGIGTTLLERAVSVLRDADFQSFRLEVRKDNLAAIRFYTKNGFTREREASFDSDYYCLLLSPTQ